MSHRRRQYLQRLYRYPFRWGNLKWPQVGEFGWPPGPSFGLYPQTMLDQGMRPFAVGQAKTIMAYFVLGWWFTAVGLYKSIKGNNQKEKNRSS